MPRDEPAQLLRPDPEPQAAPVLVFDLDGTILRCNSFPIWTLFLVAGRLRGIRPLPRLRLSLRILRLITLRKLGRAAHEDLLRGAQAAWAAFATSNTDQAPLLAALRRRVRASLWPLLTQIGCTNCDAVLATAAAAEYAHPLGNELGFRYVVATSSSR
jgi:phosphoserine phosphatase